MKGEIRKNQILEITRQICAKKGFSGTKLDEIAKKAGISRALVVQYFGNKKKLFENLIDFLFQAHPLEKDIKILKDIKKKDDFNVFYSFFIHVFNHMTKEKDSSPLKLLVFSMLEKADLYKKYYKKRMIRSINLLENYIENRIMERDFKNVNSEKIASFFISAMVYLILQHITIPEIFDEKKVTETMEEGIKTLLNGLKETQKSYEDLVNFHGHSCLGLAIGYRAAKIALKNGFEKANDEEILAIVENDSCSVDAIQYILGCTFGKGNLFFKDYGKQVFTIAERETGKAIRIALKPGIIDTDKKGTDQILKNVMELPDEELFKVEKFKMKKQNMPPKAEIKKSVICEMCGEPVMEEKTSRINGKIYCIPCEIKNRTKGA